MKRLKSLASLYLAISFGDVLTGILQIILDAHANGILINSITSSNHGVIRRTLDFALFTNTQLHASDHGSNSRSICEIWILYKAFIGGNVFHRGHELVSVLHTLELLAVLGR